MTLRTQMQAGRQNIVKAKQNALKGKQSYQESRKRNIITKIII